ncbi:MAG: GGDEF domain-containing protein, partial [Proteobacteria bacterium]|nr:GGDEF domain-containing protein [Pseudomonadota bacterium]
MRQELRPAHPARLAGHVLAAVLTLCGALTAFAQNNVDLLLQRADEVKLDDNDAFRNLLEQLDAQAGQLTQPQRDWLAYLHAWELGYRGEYPQAVTAFRDLLARTQDPTLRARARISLIFDQVNASHFEDAYTAISELLESLPQVTDHKTHYYVLLTADYLYSGAGQYDLALGYLDQAAAFDQSESAQCRVGSDRMDILYKSGKLRADDARIQPAIDACQRIGTIVDKNSIVLDQARALLDEDRAPEALKILQARDAEVLASHSAALIADFRASLAQSYLRTGDLARASEAAQSSIANANQQPFAKSVVDSYEVLYQVAKRQGDDKAALAWHEKYAIAGKGYLDDVSTRTLAFQMVHQRVLDSQRRLAAANDANKVLALQQTVDSQKARARLLYILLLVSGLVIVGGWAWRTKRSQVKFQNLARRDGLTGIANRQHFFDSAQEALRFAARNSLQACVLAMDLDHFKSVNDMHGHAAGDDALKRAVAACQVLLRSIDVFGRLGGEEFAILLPDCPTSAARQRAEQMREAIAASRREGDAAADVLVTASFGVAGTQDCGYNLTTLLAAADDAMYAAKRAGRNRVAVHRPAATQASAS